MTHELLLAWTEWQDCRRLEWEHFAAQSRETLRREKTRIARIHRIAAHVAYFRGLRSRPDDFDARLAQLAENLSRRFPQGGALGVGDFTRRAAHGTHILIPAESR